MRAKGNGHPQRCAENLLSITRGEVPYDRIKGIDARVFDKPAELAAAEFELDARWVLDTYEPRIDAEQVDITALLGEHGDFEAKAHTIRTG